MASQGLAAGPRYNRRIPFCRGIKFPSDAHGNLAVKFAGAEISRLLRLNSGLAHRCRSHGPDRTC